MTALSIDYWEKKVWIAIEIERIAVPKKIVSRIDLIRELKAIFKDNLNIDVIVVWLPYDLYWIDNKRLLKTNKFIDKLKEIFPEKKIIWVDERYTTFEAKNFQDKNKQIDDISACLILETYLLGEKR